MKLRRVRISLDLLADFLIRPTAPGIYSSSAPSDMKIIGAEIDPVYGEIVLTVTSASFNDPKDVLDPPPLMDITFTRRVA